MKIVTAILLIALVPIVCLVGCRKDHDGCLGCGISYPPPEWKAAKLNGQIYTDCALDTPWSLQQLTATRLSYYDNKTFTATYSLLTDSSGVFNLNYDYYKSYYPGVFSFTKLILHFPNDSFDVHFGVNDSTFLLSLKDSFDLQVSVSAATPLTANDTLYLKDWISSNITYVTGPFLDTSLVLGRFSKTDHYLWSSGLRFYVGWGLGHTDFEQYENVYPGPRKVTVNYSDCSGLAEASISLP